MKSLWNNFKVAFAMFSKIPMPRADWTKENMKYMLLFSIYWNSNRCIDDAGGISGTAF